MPFALAKVKAVIAPTSQSRTLPKVFTSSPKLENRNPPRQPTMNDPRLSQTSKTVRSHCACPATAHQMIDTASAHSDQEFVSGPVLDLRRHLSATTMIARVSTTITTITTAAIAAPEGEIFSVHFVSPAADEPPSTALPSAPASGGDAAGRPEERPA